MIIKSIVSLICIITVIYGIFKKSRLFFNIGYFVFGIFIVYDQLLLFIENYEIIHLSLASLWLVQVVLTYPNRLPPLTKDGSILRNLLFQKL